LDGDGREAVSAGSPTRDLAHGLGCSFGDASYGFPGAEVVADGVEEAPLAKSPEDGLHRVGRETGR
jgi:hypothetical protein